MNPELGALNPEFVSLSPEFESLSPENAPMEFLLGGMSHEFMPPSRRPRGYNSGTGR